MGAKKINSINFLFNMQLMLKNTKSYFQLEAKNKIAISYQQNYLAINNKKKKYINPSACRQNVSIMVMAVARKE